MEIYGIVSNARKFGDFNPMCMMYSLSSYLVGGGCLGDIKVAASKCRGGNPRRVTAFFRGVKVGLMSSGAAGVRCRGCR